MCYLWESVIRVIHCSRKICVHLCYLWEYSIIPVIYVICGRIIRLRYIIINKLSPHSSEATACISSDELCHLVVIWVRQGHPTVSSYGTL